MMALELADIDHMIQGLIRRDQSPQSIVSMLSAGMKVKRGQLLALLMAHQDGAFHSSTASILDVATSHGTLTPHGPFIPTAEHEAIFAAAGAGSLMVVARAGCGKTTTMVELVRRLQKIDERSIFAVSFSSSIVQSLSEKMPDGVTCATLHGLCWKVIREQRGWGGGHGFLDKNRLKTRSMAVIAEMENRPLDIEEAGLELEKLWSIARATCVRLSDIGGIMHAYEQCGMVLTDVRLVSLVAILDERLRADRGSISFDEMLTVMFDEGFLFPQCSTVIIDEAQDLNELQMRLIKRLGAQRCILVGDDRQSIFGWRGADHEAMDRAADILDITTRRPLTTTYRCASSIVREAQTIVSDIHARPTAIEGQVRHRRMDQCHAIMSGLTGGDMVLARTNAQVFDMAFRMQAMHLTYPIKILADDQSENIMRLITKFFASPNAAKETLRQAEEAASALERDGKLAAAMTLRDRAQAAHAISKQHDTAAQAIKAARSLFTRVIDHQAIMCMTIHKSKGLEADRVVFVDAHALPHPKVLASGIDGLIKQEWNLKYVGITRARNDLVLLTTA